MLPKIGVMLRGIAFFVTYGIVSAILWVLFLHNLEGTAKTIVGFVVGVGVAGLLTVLIRQGSFSEGAYNSAVTKIKWIIVFTILPSIVFAIFGTNAEELQVYILSYRCQQAADSAQAQSDPATQSLVAQCRQYGLLPNYPV